MRGGADPRGHIGHKDLGPLGGFLVPSFPCITLSVLVAVGECRGEPWSHLFSVNFWIESPG